jgi:hypothetical protein
MGALPLQSGKIARFKSSSAIEFTALGTTKSFAVFPQCKRSFIGWLILL